MSQQIFKKRIPNNLLLDLLDKICMKIDNYYILNNNAYKKGIYNELIPEFLNICLDYYFESKREYLLRKPLYKNFLTVVRQICKHNKILFTSKVKYYQSTYDIHYYIYIPNEL